MDMVFATSNPHKVTEAQQILGAAWRLRSLQDLGWSEDIAETASTLEGNAFIKANSVTEQVGLDCLAEDTGLEVEVLGGAPGVFSARYSGPGCTPADNVQKLLTEMQGEDNRAAQFRTVVALILDGAVYYFSGVVRGDIAEVPRGEGGFGYDPVFIPRGYDQTFAEMSEMEKSKISHRAIAMRKMAAFLSAYLRRKNPGSAPPQR